jgi:hypothetical protein
MYSKKYTLQRFYVNHIVFISFSMSLFFIFSDFFLILWTENMSIIFKEFLALSFFYPLKQEAQLNNI